jgi:hypothetical protein
MSKTNHVPGSLCWFELATTNHGAAKDFYSSVFGWVANDSPMGTGEVYTIFRVDGQDAAAAYALRPEQRAQGIPAHWMVYVLVKSADETAARAKRLGATITVEPFDVMDTGRMSIIQDPTGAMFSIWQPIKHAGTGITAVDGTAVWADLSTTDQVRSAKFYSDLFGWKMVEGKNMKPATPGGYYHIVNGNEMIGGVPPAEYRAPGVPSHWMIYFQVGNCDATVMQVKSLGGRLVVPVTTMKDVRRYAVLTDAQGATFAIVQSLEAQAPTSASSAKAAPKAKPASARGARPARKAKPAARRAKPAARKAKPAARRAGKSRRPAKAKAARRVRRAGKAKK